MTDEEKIKIATKKAKQTLALLYHFFIYVLFVIIFMIFNYIVTPKYIWWYWPAMGWGIGVFAHYISVKGFFSKKIEQKWIEKELKKMKEQDTPPK